jgi:hypothetical protein
MLIAIILKLKQRLNVKNIQDLTGFSGASGYGAQWESSQFYQDAIGATFATDSSELCGTAVPMTSLRKDPKADIAPFMHRLCLMQNKSKLKFLFILVII